MYQIGLALNNLQWLIFHKTQPTQPYIYIYIYSDPPPPKKVDHIFLTEIHKFNSSLFFFSAYEVDSVHEKLGP